MSFEGKASDVDPDENGGGSEEFGEGDSELEEFGLGDAGLEEFGLGGFGPEDFGVEDSETDRLDARRESQNSRPEQQRTWPRLSLRSASRPLTRTYEPTEVREALQRGDTARLNRALDDGLINETNVPLIFERLLAYDGGAPVSSLRWLLDQFKFYDVDGYIDVLSENTKPKAVMLLAQEQPLGKHGRDVLLDRVFRYADRVDLPRVDNWERLGKLVPAGPTRGVYLHRQNLLLEDSLGHPFAHEVLLGMPGTVTATVSSETKPMFTAEMKELNSNMEALAWVSKYYVSQYGWEGVQEALDAIQPQFLTTEMVRGLVSLLD